MNTTAVRAPSRAASIALLSFPLVLWAVATLFLGGDLGRAADDYAVLQRDPVTGVLDLPTTQAGDRPLFFRPVYFFVYYNLVTLCYGREWVVHVLMALVHGSVALLLYAVLRRTHVGVLAAAGGALLFLVVPQCHESVFWMAAMGNDASLAAFLVLALFVLRHALGAAVSPWLLFLLAFNVPCWNEQAAAAIPALPLLCLAARPSDQQFAGVARRAAQGTGVCLVGLALYLVLLAGTTPAGQRGSAGSFISATELLPRLAQVAHELARWSVGWWGSDVLTGGLIRASEELHSARAVIALGLLAFTGVLFAARWASPGTPGSGAATTADGRRLRWLALFGTSVVLLALAPVVALPRQPLGSRLCTVPAAGLAILTASSCAPLLRESRSRAMRRVSGLVGAALVAGTVLLAASMVGLQGLYRDSARLDRSVVEQLAAVVPHPAPGTTFVLLDVRARAGRTGRQTFDRPSAWFYHYSMVPLTREVFARQDIGATSLNPWLGLDLRELTAETFVVPFALAVEGAVSSPGGMTRIPWQQTVPFVIDERGRVALVRRVWIERAGGDDVVIADTRVPPGATAMSSFVVEERDTGRAVPLAGWRADLGHGPVPLARRRAFGLERPVLELGTELSPARLGVGIAGAPLPSRLVFRVAGADDLQPPGGLSVRCTWESEPGTALAQLELSFADLREGGRWVPLVIELGPLAAERRLWLEVACEHPASVLVTPGVRLFPDQP
ncbi:MAG TPA: hypothetical protein VF530_23405 [Planctomycetota bacterium]